jgi:hypothetical protein
MYNPNMYTLHGIYHGLWERMIASSFILPLACGKLAETNFAIFPVLSIPSHPRPEGSPGEQKKKAQKG